MRGPSGCGKTTVAKRLQAEVLEYGNSVIYCSADDYFYELRADESGFEYFYDHSEVTNAHTFCQRKYLKAIETGTDVIVVDNTNTKKCDLEFYARTAYAAGYDVELIEPQPIWIDDIDELCLKNVHGVPRQVIEQQVENCKVRIDLEEFKHKVVSNIYPVPVPPVADAPGSPKA